MLRYFPSLEETGTGLHQQEMSSRSGSKKLENNLLGTGNGQVVMNSGHHTNTDKSKVDFIYGAVPSRSKTDILLVLQSCDYNVDAAISIFSQGKAEEILNQWSYKGKRTKDGNKKKRNKKKPANEEARETVKTENTNDKEHVTSNGADGNGEQASHAPALSLDLPSDSSKATPTAVIGISSNSDIPTNPGQDTHKEKSTQPLKQQAPSHSHSSSHSKHHKHIQPKAEKLSPTNADALKRTTKDLTRSSFSLARYQLVLEEECDQSLKRMNKTFENIKNCINERQEVLVKALKEFKEQAEHLLQQRLEDAAALRLKTERVQSMSDEQVALLRADMKGFVAERKIDEELAQTKRFVCNEEEIIQELKTFGQVVPIKSTYSPVILNHPVPTSTQRSTQRPSASVISHSSSNQTTTSAINKSLTSQPTASVAHKTTTNQPTSSAIVKSTSNQPLSVDLTASHPSPVVMKGPSTLHEANQATGRNRASSKATESSAAKHTGPLPKISTLISLAMAKSSVVVSEGLQEAGEAPKQQGAVSTSERKRGGRGRNQSKDPSRNQHNRPSTAPVQQGKQQRTREPRSKRPQSNRQQRQNKDVPDKEKEEKGATQMNEAKANQDSTSVQSESNQQKTKQESQSEQHQDGRRKRARRRGSGRDPKPRANDEAPKDNSETASDTKKTDDAVARQKEDNMKEEKNAVEDGLVEEASICESNPQPKEEAAELKTQSSDGALPQRSQRSQNRRNNSDTGGNKENLNTHDLNGSTNGMNHDTPNGKEKEEPSAINNSERQEEEEKLTPKLTQVVAPALINGHDISHETNPSKPIQLEKTEEDHSEVNGFEATNGTGDDCLVER